MPNPVETMRERRSFYLPRLQDCNHRLQQIVFEQQFEFAVLLPSLAKPNGLLLFIILLIHNRKYLPLKLGGNCGVHDLLGVSQNLLVFLIREGLHVRHQWLQGLHVLLEGLNVRVYRTLLVLSIVSSNILNAVLPFSEDY